MPATTKKKTATKKAATKKPAAKKPATKKPAAKKAPTKKAPTKKSAAKKAATKKAAAKKAATKKPAAKKTAAKKKKATKKKATKKKVGGVTVKGTRHDPPLFLLILIPVGLSPYERAERFEDPIEDALGALGAVSGGGTSFGEDGVAESSEIEVEVNDVIRALPIIRRVLVEQQAPPGSVITRLTRAGAFEVLFELGG